MPQAPATLIGPRRVTVGTRRRLVWRAVELGLFGFLALALAYFVGAADWIGVAMVLAVIGGGVLVLIDPKLIAMLWLAGQPTLFVFANNVASEVPFFTVERALFLVLLGLVMARAIFRSVPARAVSATEWAVLGFLAMLTVSFATTFAGKDVNTIRSDVALLFQCYLMPWLSVLIAARLDWTERDALRLLRVLAATGLLVVAIGASQRFAGLSWFTAQYFEVVHEGRIVGTFANAVEYGSVAVGLAILTLLLVFHLRDPFVKALWCLAAIAMIGAALLSLSRSPLVGAAAGLAFLFVRDPRIRPLLIAGGFVAAILGMIAIPLFLDTAGLMARITEIEPIYNRLALFATATQMVLDNPLTGVGFGRYGFADNKIDYLTGFGPVSAQWAADVGIPHLEYLHVAVLTGVIGGTLYLLAFAMLWRSLSRIARDRAASPFVRRHAVYVQALLVSILVNGLFVDFMAYNYFAALVYFMVGVSMGMAGRGAAAPQPNGAAVAFAPMPSGGMPHAAPSP